MRSRIDKRITDYDDSRLMTTDSMFCIKDDESIRAQIQNHDGVKIYTSPAIPYHPFQNGDEDSDNGIQNNQHYKQKGTSMATVVKKKDLKYEDGYLTYNGTTIFPSCMQRYLELESYIQYNQFKNEKDSIDIPKFETKTNFGGKMIAIQEPNTPVHLAKAEEADALGKEGKLISAHIKAEWLLNDDFAAVTDFVCSNSVVLYDDDYQSRLIDTPVLGNPLTLTKAKLTKIICDLVGYPLD